MEPRPHERGNARGPHAPTPRGELQWSHVLTNVETRLRSQIESENSTLQWSHVLTNVETSGWPASLRTLRRCFNGATSSRTWQRSTISEPSSQVKPLQWSHVLTNVETALTSKRWPSRVKASMEPRPHERGNSRRRTIYE